MFDHIGFKVRNLPAALDFYRAALAPLGLEVCVEDAGYAGIGAKGAPALWIYGDEHAKASSLHLAFRARSRAAVERFHAAGLAAGGNDQLFAGPDSNARLFGDAGNDSLSYHPGLLRVDGGAGIDRLIVDGGTGIDFTALPPARVTGIEIVDLSSDGTSQITLDERSLLALSTTTDTLRILGDNTDSVTVGGAWTQGPDTSVTGTAFHSYTSGSATLLVAIDITTVFA